MVGARRAVGAEPSLERSWTRAGGGAAGGMMLSQPAGEGAVQLGYGTRYGLPGGGPEASL